MRKHNLKYRTFLIVFAQAIAFSAHASESSSTDIVDVLTCNTRLTEQQAVALLQSDWFKEATAAEDGFELVKPVQSEGICIRQAKVVGAFGVLVVVGQVCDGKYDALKGAFEKQFPEAPGTAIEPGKLFIGKSAVGEGVIYRGMATMPPKPMTRAREVAYLCARQMGGTQ
jgi:hypothetical protein